MLFRIALCAVGLELQAEIDCRIDEIGDGREWHGQRRRNPTEAEADRELVLADLEIPEAVLDDDRHLVRKALDQMLRDMHPRHLGLEGDVEMVAARQAAALLDLVKDPPDHVAQGLLHDLVIGNQGLRWFLAHRLWW